MKKIFLLIPVAMLLASCSYFGHGGHAYNTPEEEHMTEAEQMKAANYRKADRALPYRHKLKQRCLTVNGQKVCGYDCKESMGHVKCAKRNDQRCVVGHSGEIACGYDCKVTHHAAVCGKYRYDNCVANAYGDVRCGNNCYEREDGEVVCGK